MIISFVLATAEKVLNRYLQLDPETIIRLRELDGKVIAMQFQHLDYQVYFQCIANKICLLAKYNGLADVTLQGTPFDFMRLGVTEGSSSALFASDIVVSGDMEVAEKFKAVFAQLNIDWEEQLSQVTGDVIAHQVGSFVRALCEWARQSSSTLQKDITEYMQEETRLLPTRVELEDFFAAVDVLRNDVDRLQARIERLQQNLHS
jgi:ubiquinone biosynthesis protein UbiJ